jgi:hypothetical protein
MAQFGWYSFQFVVILLAFWGAKTIEGGQDLGMAPAVVAVFVAWLATGLLAD